MNSCTASTRPGTEKPDSTKKATTGALRAPVGRGPKGRAYAFFAESGFAMPGRVDIVQDFTPSAPGKYGHPAHPGLANEFRAPP